MGGDHHWAKASQELRTRLVKAIPHDVLKELHRKSPGRHLAIAARQFLILAAASAVSWLFREPWIWIPAAVIAGWTIFNFTVLLHEAVHHAIFNGPHPKGDRLLGLLYAAPAVGSFVFSATSGWTNRVHRHGMGVIVAATIWGFAIIGFGSTSRDWFAISSS